MAYEVEISKKTYIMMVIQTAIVQIINGIMENFRSMVFPAMRTEYNLSYDTLSYIQAGLGYSYVLFGFIATICAEKWGCKVTYLIGMVVWFIGSVAIFFTYELWVVIFLLFVLWFGMSYIHISNNSLTTAIFVKNKGIMISYTHFMFGIGTFLSPVIYSNINPLFNYGFRSSYAFMTIPIFIAIIYISFVPYDFVRKFTDDGPHREPLGVKQLIKHPHQWLFSIADCFIMLLSYATLDWALIYLQDIYGWDPTVQGAQFMSVYTIGYALSRLVFSFGYQKVGYFRSLFIFLALVLITYILGFSLGENGIYILACTGIFIGPLWPLIVCCSMEFWQESAPSATSLMITLQGLFKEIFNLLIGLANQYINNSVGYKLNMLFVVLGFLGMIWVYIIMKRKLKKEKLDQDVEMNTLKDTVDNQDIDNKKTETSSAITNVEVINTNTDLNKSNSNQDITIKENVKENENVNENVNVNVNVNENQDVNVNQEVNISSENTDSNIHKEDH